METFIGVMVVPLMETTISCFVSLGGFLDRIWVSYPGFLEVVICIIFYNFICEVFKGVFDENMA